MKPFLLICFLLFLSCKTDNDVGIPCTTEAAAGLNVTVKDAETEQFLYDEASVVAVDGSYSETLTLIGGVSPVFIGAWEREGSYIITVTHKGYTTYVSEVITVVSDECHVIPRFLEVSLQPE